MNKNVEARLQQEIEAFAANVTAILQDAVAQSVTEVLGPASARRAGPSPASTRKVAKKAAGGKAKRKGKRIRRTEKDLERIASKLLTQVKRREEQSMEEIGKALGMTTAQLALPVKMLLDEKRIKKKGHRRATRYSAR